MIDLDDIAILGKFTRNDQTLDPPAGIKKRKNWVFLGSVRVMKIRMRYFIMKSF